MMSKLRFWIVFFTLALGIPTFGGNPLFANEQEFLAHYEKTLSELQTRFFSDWPDKPSALKINDIDVFEENGLSLTVSSIPKAEAKTAPLYLVHRAGLKTKELDLIVLNVIDQDGWQSFLTNMGASFPEAFSDVELPDLNEKNYKSELGMHKNFKWGMAYLPLPQNKDLKSAQAVRHIRHGIRGLRLLEGATEPQLWVQASNDIAAYAAVASLFEKDINRLELHTPPTKIADLDVVLMVSFAAKRSRVRLYAKNPKPWEIVQSRVEQFGWNKGQFQIREAMAE
ncbi:MAG: hypothetical protein AAF226_01915 [Verrucomicrobiota bacterium]